MIEHYHLADILTRYLLAQYHQSEALAGLGLQLSQAFVIDALASAQSRAHDQHRNDVQQQQQGGVLPLVERQRQQASSCAAAGAHADGACSAEDAGNLRGRSPVASECSASPPAGRGKSLDVRSSSSRLNGQAKTKQTLDRQAASLRRFGTRTILMYLMQELEVLLTQYLSTNWHNMDMVKRANAMDMRDDGLVCVAAPSLHKSASTHDSFAADGSALSLSPEQRSLVHVSSRQSESSTAGSANLHGAASRGSLSAYSLAGSSTSLTSSEGSGHGRRAFRRARRNWHRALQV